LKFNPTGKSASVLARKTRGEIAGLYSAVIANAAKQSILSRLLRDGCFAALAMTVMPRRLGLRAGTQAQASIVEASYGDCL
jgi:hypothetical protein